jgi:hypothetical protein
MEGRKGGKMRDTERGRKRARREGGREGGREGWENEENSRADMIN